MYSDEVKDIGGMVPDNESHPCNFITHNACKEYSSIKAPVHILTINTSNFICNWEKDLNFQCSGMFCSNGFNIKQIWYQIFGCFACFLYHLCLVVTWPYTNPILQNNPKSITFWSALQKLTSIRGLQKQRSEEAHSWGAACNCVAGLSMFCSIHDTVFRKEILSYTITMWRSWYTLNWHGNVIMSIT
jgi:hypothetical protein